MAGIADYSTTAASNTTVGGVSIAGTAPVSNFDNAVRAFMADIATALAAGTFSANGYVAKAAGYSVVVGDRGKVIDCTATLELELPAVATAGAGFMFWIKANGGAVTVDPNGTENINGASTSLVVADGSIAMVVCTGAAWHSLVSIAASAVGVSVQSYDADTLKADTDDNLTAGFTATAANDGTKSSGTYTPDPAGGNFKRIVNGGAFTLAEPSASGDYTMIIQITNNGSAGAITLSGFDKTSGPAFTTTNGHDFFVHIVKLNGFTSAAVVALQ